MMYLLGVSMLLRLALIALCMNYFFKAESGEENLLVGFHYRKAVLSRLPSFKLSNPIEVVCSRKIDDQTG